MQRLARSGEWRRRAPYDEAWERFGSAYAALLIKQRQYDEARAILSVLRDSARDVGYVYREAPLEAALASCNWQAGDIDAAFECLNRGFALTRGHGFTRSIFDETPAMIQVIAAALESRTLALRAADALLLQIRECLCPASRAVAALPASPPCRWSP